MCERTFRGYSCRRCGIAVSICSGCDAGQVYCNGECAQEQRRLSMRAAGARYQRTPRGARCHAARQKKLRASQAQCCTAERKIVTHHGCENAAVAFTVPTLVSVSMRESEDARAASDEPVSIPGDAPRCDFCGATPLSPEPRVRASGTGVASTGTALRGHPQARPRRRARTRGLPGRDRSAVARHRGRRGRAIYPHRRLQAGSGTEASGARHGACVRVASAGSRGAAAGAADALRAAKMPSIRRWLLAELHERFGLSLEELARRFERNKSWVSRRLALIQVLPTTIQDSVRAGTLAAHAAMKYLVPLARANAQAATQLATAITPLKPTSRQIGALYAGWQSGSARTRELILASPQMYLQAQATQEPAAPSATQRWLNDLGALGGHCAARTPPPRAGPPAAAAQSRTHGSRAGRGAQRSGRGECCSAVSSGRPADAG